MSIQYALFRFKLMLSRFGMVKDSNFDHFKLTRDLKKKLMVDE